MKTALLLLLSLFTLSSKSQDKLSGCWSLHHVEKIITSYDDEPGNTKEKVIVRDTLPKMIIKTGTLYVTAGKDSLKPVGFIKFTDTATVNYTPRYRYDAANNNIYSLDTLSTDLIRFSKVITIKKKGYEPPQDAPHPRGKGSPGYIQKEYHTITLRRCKEK